MPVATKPNGGCLISDNSYVADAIYFITSEKASLIVVANSCHKTKRELHEHD